MYEFIYMCIKVFQNVSISLDGNGYCFEGNVIVGKITRQRYDNKMKYVPVRIIVKHFLDVEKLRKQIASNYLNLYQN